MLGADTGGQARKKWNPGEEELSAEKKKKKKAITSQKEGEKKYMK
jgi:hypothetical protein